ncbi:MAG: hypothetical protein H6741_21485 [Alphaproteobacteria bacterium]|nr:hypothetical protein [Alphaproteobacteria bacterium]
MSLRTLMILFGLSLVALGCGDNDPGDDSSSGDDSADTDDSSGGDDSNGDDSSGGDDSGEEEVIAATITGTVTVQLFTEENESRSFVSWADAGYTSFPFGRIFVGAYSADESGARTFHADDTVRSPSLTGDAYTLDLELTGVDTVQVYAHLDYHQDRVLGTNDPTGNYGFDIELEDGDAITGVDITILAPLHLDDGGGGGGGEGCDTVEVSGEVLITVSYAGGEVATFLQSTSGAGPYSVGWWQPTAEADGASVTYSMAPCANAGDYRLRGAWDSNGNELIDPRDQWGGYVSGFDEAGEPISANPLTIGSSDLTADIVIPITSGEDADPFSIVPFTALSGDVVMASGSNFDEDLPADTTVYVAAMRYRPNLDIGASTLEANAYSVETFSWSDLQGNAAQAFTLPVPANTITYLWAYADTDSDGVLNESGELVATPTGSDTGRISTGNSGYSGITMELTQPEN